MLPKVHLITPALPVLHFAEYCHMLSAAARLAIVDSFGHIPRYASDSPNTQTGEPPPCENCPVPCKSCRHPLQELPLPLKTCPHALQKQQHFTP